MSVEIYIARHGQNQDNADGILNGHRDLPLTDLGRQQARDLGEAVRQAGFTLDAVYSSPLSRALETAEIASEIAGLPKPIVYDQLIERNFGAMTGTPVDEIEERCGQNILKNQVMTYFLSPDGAETFPELVKRGRVILDHIRYLHREGKVLLVCHGDIGKMIYCAATNKKWRDVLLDFHIGNGELIKVSDDETAHVVHLEQHNT